MTTPPTSRPVVAVVAAALTAAGVAFAPAPTSQADPASASTVPQVEVEVTDDGEVHRTVGGLSDRLGFAPDDDLRDPMTWFERSRRVVEARGTETAAATDGTCIAGCDEGSEMGEAEGVVEVWASTTPTGDLDGDGTDEVLELVAEIDGEDVTSTTTARSGTDGAVLWTTQDAGLGYLSAVPDIDGDGLVDIMSVAWTSEGGFSGSCGSTAVLRECSRSESWDDTVVVTGLNGRTGAPVGSHEVASSYSAEDSSTSVAGPTGRSGTGEVRVEVDNGFFGFALVDGDGDGTHQLAHESFDATFTQDSVVTINDTPLGWADVVAYDEAEDLSGAIVMVDLATGTSQEVLTLDDALAWGWAVRTADGDRLLVDVLPEIGQVRGGCAWISPVITGECADDTGLPTSGANDAEPTRVLYDAAFEPVWEVPLPPESFFVYSTGTDLDGDGTQDLFDIGVDPETWEDSVTAVSGATGETLWTAPTSLVAPSGSTLAAGSVEFDDEDRVTVLGQVLDPATGQVVTERELASHELPENSGEDTASSISVGLWLTELTAGTTDLVGDLHSAVHELEEVCETWEYPDGSSEEVCYWTTGDVISEQADLRGVEGTDLTDLVHLQDPSFKLLDVLELDGNGTAELLGVEFAEGGWPPTATRALRLDTTQLWELPGSVLPIGPIDTADGTTDLLVEDSEAGTASVRDGSDLTVRWSIDLY